jgi:tetratricopeptide (TPR) repeat protein
MDTGHELAREAHDLARSSGLQNLLVHSLIHLAITSEASREDLAKAYYEEAERAAREYGIGDEWQHVIEGNLGNIALNQHDYTEASVRFASTLAAARKRDLPYSVANALLDLGMTDLARNEYEQAAVWFGECLPICESLEIAEFVSWVLEGVAAISVQRGDAIRAARLLGVAKAIQDRAGIDGSYYPVALELRERTTGAAQEIVGESEFTAAWVAGRELDFDEAIALAKSGLD